MRKFLGFFISLVILVGISGNVFAADVTTPGGTGSSDVSLTAEAATFSVTVPLKLPIDVNANGVVTASTTAKIINNSAGAVKVTAVTISGVGDWVIIDYTSNVASEKVGAKKIAFSINECTTGIDGTIAINTTNFPKLDGANETTSDELALTYTAKVPAQKTAIAESTNIASVVFTIGWDE